jgi:lysozyme
MPELNAVIDISHYNGDVDLGQAKDDGIIGVIHKATQSTNYTDPNYTCNRTKAADAGLLWGAYHFGTGGDGAGQADYFLSVVSPGPYELLVLDLETNTQGSSMSLDDAHDFVSRVYDVTGKWPGLYSGSYIKDQLGSNKDEVLAYCWFWLAQYGSTAVVPANWPCWTMWQYTDGNYGPDPHSVNGIGNCDRDKFNGDEAGLRKLWGY